MRKIYISLLCGLMISTLVTSCDSTKKDLKEETERIEAYVAAHPEYSFVKKSSGLYYADIKVGEGATPDSGDRVSVWYTGTFLDDTVFDSNEANMATGENILRFILDGGQMISGFNEGVSYMSVGGEAIMILPSALGYGNTNNSFDPYTPLVFKVKLAKVQRL